MGISGDLFIFIVIFKSRLDQVQLIRSAFKETDGINVKSVVSQLFKWSMSYSTEVKSNFTISNTLKVLCCTQPCTQLCPTQLCAFISQRISIKHRWHKSQMSIVVIWAIVQESLKCVLFSWLTTAQNQSFPACLQLFLLFFIF